MPSNRPVILPLALAYIREYGEQSVPSLTEALGFSGSSVNKAVMNARDAGQLIVARRERVSNGSPKLWYGLPVYPKISAGEWRGYEPTGTPPEHVWRAKL